jgi:hypothetical protein
LLKSKLHDRCDLSPKLIGSFHLIHNSLSNRYGRPQFQIPTKHFSPNRGAHSGCDPDCGVGAVPACGLASRARAASGIMSAGITAGARGASAGLGQAQGG